MLGEALHKRLIAPEFRPFTIVLANGERIDVLHRDSIGFPTAEVRGTCVYTNYVHVLETREDEVIDRTISVPLIAQIIDRYEFRAPNGSAKAG